jgi:NRPS condensation-like uncharacterized protein
MHIFITKDNNAFNAGRGVYGKKKGAMNLGLDLLQIKDYCKANKITLNHYYMSILSKTIHRYLSIKKKDPKAKLPHQVTACFPVSLRPPFKKLTDIELNN